MTVGSRALLFAELGQELLFFFISWKIAVEY